MTLIDRLSALITSIGADIKTLTTGFAGKQPTLVSGTNIKTVNGSSILGSGNLVVAPSKGFPATIARMTAAQSRSVVTLDNITELVGSMVAGATYEVEAFVTFQSSATTTGCAIGFTAPSDAVSELEIVVPISSGAAATQLRCIFPSSTNSASGSVIGTGVTAISSNHTAHVRGIVKCVTAGSLQLTFASEVATSAVTLQIGSILVMRRIL